VASKTTAKHMLLQVPAALLYQHALWCLRDVLDYLWLLLTSALYVGSSLPF